MTRKAPIGIALGLSLIAVSCNSTPSAVAQTPDGGVSAASDGASAASDGASADAPRPTADLGPAGDVGSPPVRACPGAPPSDGRELCRKPEDCRGYPAFAKCAFDYMAPAGCGACNRPIRQCSNDADCRGDGGSADQICLSTPLPCSCGGDNTACAAGCTPTSCPTGQRCNASRRCELIPCTEGVDCGPLALCAPSRLGGLANGCAYRSCRLDGFTCPAGFECWPAGGDRHGCGPLRCDRGGAPCPMNSVCDPGAAGTGCRVKSCKGDGDCDCGACIMGLCYARLFICSPVGVP